jgi:hypothetical protein
MKLNFTLIIPFCEEKQPLYVDNDGLLCFNFAAGIKVVVTCISEYQGTFYMGGILSTYYQK